MPDPATREAVARHVAEWASRKAEVADLGAELSEPVRVEPHGPDAVDLVFHGRLSSRLWKGLMVELVQELRAAQPGISLIGFWDLVANVQHPASQLAQGDSA